jgi:hypothetical protein
VECVVCQIGTRLGGRFGAYIFWCYIQLDGDKVVRIVLVDSFKEEEI